MLNNNLNGRKPSRRLTNRDEMLADRTQSVGQQESLPSSYNSAHGALNINQSVQTSVGALTRNQSDHDIALGFSQESEELVPPQQVKFKNVHVQLQDVDEVTEEGAVTRGYPSILSAHQLRSKGTSIQNEDDDIFPPSFVGQIPRATEPTLLDTLNSSRDAKRSTHLSQQVNKRNQTHASDALSAVTKFSHVPSACLRETLLSETTNGDGNFDNSLFDDMYDPNQLGDRNDLPNMANIFEQQNSPQPIQMEDKHGDRFLILILFSLCLLINAMAQVTFVPVHTKVLFAFNCMRAGEAVTDGQIDFINWQCIVVFLPMSLIQQYVTYKYGLRRSVVIGSVLQFFGLSIRCFVGLSWWCVIIGQLLVSMAWPFFLNVPGLVSVVWFPKSERIFSTMFGSSIGWVGVLVGYYLSDLICQEESDYAAFLKQMTEDDVLNCDPSQQWLIFIMKTIRNDFRTKVERTLIFVALLQFVVTSCIIFFFKDMYFNKYGEYSQDKEEVALRDDTIVGNITGSNNSYVTASRSPSQLGRSPISSNRNTSTVARHKSENRLTAKSIDRQFEVRSFGVQIRQLSKNCQYVALIWCAGFMTAPNLLFPRYLMPILREFDGYDKIVEKDSPLLNMIKFGLLGSLLTGIILTISRRLFKITLILLNLIIGLSFAGIQYYLQTTDYEKGHQYVLYLLYLNGFAQLPLQFIFYEWAIAITPLISESLSSGNINMQNCFICLFGFAAVYFDIDFIPWFDKNPR